MFFDPIHCEAYHCIIMLIIIHIIHCDCPSVVGLVALQNKQGQLNKQTSKYYSNALFADTFFCAYATLQLIWFGLVARYNRKRARHKPKGGRAPWGFKSQNKTRFGVREKDCWSPQKMLTVILPSPPRHVHRQISPGARTPISASGNYLEVWSQT